MTRVALTLAALAALTALGVADFSGGDGSHATAGRVAWAGGELAGHVVEVALADDPTRRGFGTIGPDGRFTLQRLLDGKTAAGLPAGKYHARLILNDGDDGRPARPKVPKRYLDFKTAGWSIEVPAAGEVTLPVAAR